MKKILISIFMVIALICMQLPTTILAATDATTNFLLDENFDSWNGEAGTIKDSETNLNINITKDADAASDSSGVMKLTNSARTNARFQMQPKNSSSAIIYPNSTVVFSADFHMNDYDSVRKVFYYGGQSTNAGEDYQGTLLSFESDEYENEHWIRAYYGDAEKSNYNRIKYIMPYETGKWYHIDMILDLSSCTYDVYVNGVKYEVGNFPSTKSGVTPSYNNGMYLNRLMVQSTCSAVNDGVAYVDNVYFAPLANVSASRYAAKSTIVEKTGKIGYATTFDIPVTFDNAIDISTYAEGEITLTGGETPIALTPVWNSDAKGFTVTIPSNSLTASTTYNLAISGVSDVYGNTVTSAISFATASTPIDYKEPPAITISAPATANKGDNVEVTVESIDANDSGSIIKVEYYDNGEKIGETATEPYSYTISSIGAGAHSITAKAYGSAGLSGESSAVAINVTDNLVTNLTPTFNGGSSATAISDGGVINYILNDSEKAQMANGADFSFEINYMIPSTTHRIFMGLNGYNATAFYTEANCYALLNGTSFKFRGVDSTTAWTDASKTARIFAADVNKNAKIIVNINYLKGTYGVAVYVEDDLRQEYTYDLGVKFANNGSLSKLTEITSFDFKFDKANATVNSISAKITVPRPVVSSVVFKDTAAGSQTTDAREVSKNTDEIVVTFSENMSEESFTATSVTLADNEDNAVGFIGEYNETNKTYTLDLEDALDYNKTYILTLTSDIKSAALVSISDSKVVTFNTPVNKYTIAGTPEVNGRQISFSGVFENNTASSQSVVVILAAYNNAGKLVGVTFDADTVSAADDWDNIALLCTADEAVASTRVFVWDSFSSMKPLIAAE